MITRELRNVLHCVFLVSVTSNAVGHGLVEKPPSRNWYCGVITKPHEVTNGVAEHPECGDAFANDVNGGYQFMSVLTHTRGRAQVRPLPAHVCGFGSETWNGGATPWDQAADWPSNPMSAGRQEFLWNVQWGPHFSDTEEFRYWITKPSFQYERNRALTWNDFESTEFCALGYDDSRPNENPNVIPLKDNSQFRTFCDVPARQGRHIIYAEWGRNQWTLERFHGCIDVVFGDGNPPPPPNNVVADINLNTNMFIGEGSLTLDASSSQGNNLSYTWSVSAPDNSIYSIADPNLATTTLTLGNPSAAQTVSVSLLVRNNVDSSTATASFLHEPEAVSMWVDLGQLTTTAQTYQAGDKLSVRTVSGNGQDNFYPTPALELNTNNAGADAWPLTLAQAVNALDADIKIGVLGSGDQVNPVASATANRVYAVNGSDVVSAFLQVDRVGVDLIVSSFSTSSDPIGPGTLVTYSADITNQGNGVAGANFLRLVLSSDPVIDGNDRRLSRPSPKVPQLTGGAVHQASGTVRIPANTLPGNYFLGAIVDPSNRVSESDETNNTDAAPITVDSSSGNGPDLVVNALTTTSNVVSPGATLSYRVNALNQGTANAGGNFIRLVLSPDATINGNDRRLTRPSLRVPALAAGANHETSGSVRIPLGVVPGNYFLGAMVDPSGRVSETDESNNTSRGAPVTVMAPTRLQ